MSPGAWPVSYLLEETIYNSYSAKYKVVVFQSTLLPQRLVLALPEGLEPPASELEVRHSIQLSYGSNVVGSTGPSSCDSTDPRSRSVPLFLVAKVGIEPTELAF